MAEASTQPSNKARFKQTISSAIPERLFFVFAKVSAGRGLPTKRMPGRSRCSATSGCHGAGVRARRQIVHACPFRFVLQARLCIQGVCTRDGKKKARACALKARACQSKARLCIQGARTRRQKARACAFKARARALLPWLVFFVLQARRARLHNSRPLRRNSALRDGTELLALA